MVRRAAPRRRKPSTYAQLSEDEKAARKRAQWARQKRKTRERMAPEVLSIAKARDMQRCVELAHVMQFIEQPEGREGCWLWTGPWKAAPDRARPVVRAGQYGLMQADKAVFHAVHGRPVPAKCWLTRECGRAECVAPHHQLLENRTLQFAKRRERGTTHGTPEALRTGPRPDERGDD